MIIFSHYVNMYISLFFFCTFLTVLLSGITGSKNRNVFNFLGTKIKIVLQKVGIMDTFLHLPINKNRSPNIIPFGKLFDIRLCLL